MNAVLVYLFLISLLFVFLALLFVLNNTKSKSNFWRYNIIDVFFTDRLNRHGKLFRLIFLIFCLLFLLITMVNLITDFYLE